MKRKRRTEEQIIGILKEHEAGMKTADLCRKHGISEGCFYNWKAKWRSRGLGSKAAEGAGERERQAEKTAGRRHARQRGADFLAGRAESRGRAAVPRLVRLRSNSTSGLFVARRFEPKLSPGDCLGHLLRRFVVLFVPAPFCEEYSVLRTS
jgi:putative transposase